MQFALYVDNILARIELQKEAYREGHNVPPRLFEIYEEQREGLEALKAKYGPIVSVEQVMEAKQEG
jgi:phosphoenolpyruvate carboxykinase (GTP)